MAFTTTLRGSGIITSSPTSSDVEKAVEVCAGNAEATKYLLDRLVAKLKAVGLLEQAGPLIEKVEEYFVLLQEQDALQGDAWAGDPACLRTNFQNLQINLAAKAQEMLSRAGLIHMDFALNDASEFLRGYTVDPELITYCDDLFNAWLAENNMVSQGGQIFEADEHGKLIRADDKEGTPKKANADTVKQLLLDPEKNFEGYLKARKIDLKAKELPYPKQTKAAAVTPSVPKQPKAQPVKEKAHEKEAEIKPSSTPGQSRG